MSFACAVQLNKQVQA